MKLRWTLRKRESLRESVWETETPAMWTWVPNHQKFLSDPEQIKQNLKGLHPISHAWSLKVTIKPGVCKNEYGNAKKVNFDLTILGHQDKMTVNVIILHKYNAIQTAYQGSLVTIMISYGFPLPFFFCANHFEMSQFTSTKKSVWNDKKQYQHYSMFPTHLRKYNQSENHLCHGSQYLWKTSIWQIMTKINQRNPMVKHELANLKLRRWKRKIDA